MCPAVPSGHPSNLHLLAEPQGDCRSRNQDLEHWGVVVWGLLLYFLWHILVFY